MEEKSVSGLHRSAMSKSEVYSWRLEPALKVALEDAARVEGLTLSGLLERIAREWLDVNYTVDEDEQRRLHKAARKWIGTVKFDEPNLSERVTEVVQEILWEKHARNRPD